MKLLYIIGASVLVFVLLTVLARLMGKKLLNLRVPHKAEEKVQGAAIRPPPVSVLVG